MGIYILKYTANIGPTLHSSIGNDIYLGLFLPGN